MRASDALEGEKSESARVSMISMAASCISSGLASLCAGLTMVSVVRRWGQVVAAVWWPFALLKE
jgi:hypothetical protein